MLTASLGLECLPSAALCLLGPTSPCERRGSYRDTELPGTIPRAPPVRWFAKPQPPEHYKKTISEVVESAEYGAYFSSTSRQVANRANEVIFRRRPRINTGTSQASLPAWPTGLEICYWTAGPAFVFLVESHLPPSTPAEELGCREPGREQSSHSLQ